MFVRLTWVFMSVLVLVGCGGASEGSAPEVFTPMDDIYQAAAAGDVRAVEGFIADGQWDHLLTNAEGLTPLHAAVKGGNPEIVALMVEYGAQPSLADSRGRTPLQYAQELGKDDMVSVLQQLGATE